MSDIVAELDRWLEAHATGWQKTRPLIQRARDEIVALRAIADLAVSGGFEAVVKQACAEQRERDAQIADEWDELGCYGAGGIAAAIPNQGDET